MASDQAEAGTANRSVFLESEASMLSAQADLLRAEYDRSVAAADLSPPHWNAMSGSQRDGEVQTCERFLIVLCLAACARAGGGEKTNALAEYSGALERLAATVAPAVVQVQVSAWCASASANREDAATLTSCRVVGSGVIVDPSGYIITNEHVVRNARRIRVMLTPKSDHSADLPHAPRKTASAGCRGCGR